MNNTHYKQKLNIIETLVSLFPEEFNWSGASKQKDFYGVPWSIELIEKVESKWNWYFLGTNDSLPWSIELIETFKDKWNYKHVKNIIKIQLFNNILVIMDNRDKQKLNIIETLVTLFPEEFNWFKLSMKENFFGFFWTEEIIEKYEDKLIWFYLSQNKSLPWTSELIEKFEDKWDWFFLSASKSLPWSEEFIEKYRERWRWGTLSENESLPWSIEFIEKYEDKWDYEDMKKHNNNPIVQQYLKENDIVI